MKRDIRDKHKVITWFTENSVVANLLMLGLLLSGIYTAFTIQKEGFPSFPPTNITVEIPVQGGTPKEVERGISRKIEDSLKGVNGIDHIRSTSSENRSLTTITAIDNYDLDKLLDDVKAEVDAIPSFPSLAENPIITSEGRERTVLWIEVHGDANERSLKETAKKIRDELLNQPDISEVEVFGSRDYEISIEVSERQLQVYGLTFDEVASAVSKNSLDLSGGDVRTERGNISLKLRNQAYVKEDYEQIPVRNNPNGSQVLIKDIATVNDGYIDQEYLNLFQDERTVSLKVIATGNDDILKGVKQAQTVAETFKDHPKDITITAWLDGSKDIKNRLFLLGSNGGTGILLVLLVLMLFLNFRLALWVSIGIPISLLGALSLFTIPGVDLSVNVISAFGFLVVLGIVVDDAIVIGEAIYSEKEEDIEDPTHKQSLIATVKGASKVAAPATFGVLTTIAAFMPLIFVTGRQGQVFGQIATAVICCLIISLVESKLILPSHLLHIKVHRKPRNIISKSWRAFQGIFTKGLRWLVDAVYCPTLRFLVAWRYAVFTLFVAIFMITISLFPAKQLRFVFFPNILRDSMSIVLEMEQGQSSNYLHQQTHIISKKIVELSQQYEEKYNHNPFINIQISASSDTLSSTAIELTSSESREFLSTAKIIQDIEKSVGRIAGARSLEIIAKAGPPGGDLSVNLESDNLEELQIAAMRLREALKDYTGVYNISDSFSSGKPEIVYEPNTLGRNSAGLDNQSLSAVVRDAFFGREAERIQRDREEVLVKVRYPAADRESLDALRTMRVRLTDGTEVPFSSVADIQYGESLASIDRYDGKRIVTVEGYINKSLTTSQEVFKKIKSDFMPTLQAEYPSISIGISGALEERAKSMASLKQGFAISLVVIYVLLAIPLRSYIRPVIIMFVIPFGIIGALLGHYIMGSQVSILSIFGIIALSGVVVNDSLVLIHRIIEMENNGVPTRQAIIEAAPSRFRAILLTSLTTFLGLYPLLLETQFQAQFLKPMAISLSFGVLFATLITLFLLPLSLLIINDIGNFLKWLYSKTS